MIETFFWLVVIYLLIAYSPLIFLCCLWAFILTPYLIWKFIFDLRRKKKQEVGIDGEIEIDGEIDFENNTMKPWNFQNRN